jgi:imidazoleglycerol-phosphate dehydratase
MSGVPRRGSTTSLFTTTGVACVDLTKNPKPIHTGIGFLDHMMDQINSHAQIGVGLTVHHHSDFSSLSNDSKLSGSDDKDHPSSSNHNRLSQANQASLLRHVGWTLGSQLALLNKFLSLEDDTTATSRFCCPLDEALVECVLVKPAVPNKKRKLEEGTTSTTSTKPVGDLIRYELAPFGKFPKETGRTKIGHLETAALEEFWKAFAKSTGLQISLVKLRGDNGHHIVESTFKAFSRAIRNLLDGTNTTTASTTPNHKESAPYQQAMWGESSLNWKQSLELKRQGTVERSTKETNIHVALQLDGGVAGVQIDTGIQTLDRFFTVLAQEAALSLTIACRGDLWVDDHHTAEDVAIAVGQVLNTALGTKAGLNRMWCAQHTVGAATVEVTMDLSNRPCLIHNLALEDGKEEHVGDLSVEMFDHVLESLVVNGRMTVHIVLEETAPKKEEEEENGTEPQHPSTLEDRAMATAAAFGRALKYWTMVDHRRAGKTASSKGTLSV